jgi:hypothetical protein
MRAAFAAFPLRRRCDPAVSLYALTSARMTKGAPNWTAPLEGALVPAEAEPRFSIAPLRTLLPHAG